MNAAKKTTKKRKTNTAIKSKTTSKKAKIANEHVYDPTDLDTFIAGFLRRNPSEPEFQQAVREVAYDVFPYLHEYPVFTEKRIFERMTEPDRIIVFRVTWEDDAGNTRINRGYRVQFNNSIGPYKGGLRFHHSVNLSIIKFLAFEQTFKNSLTTLPLGSAKGGSDFNPHGKSDREIARFCNAFMTELYRYIGPNVDVPAGDIGVGGREIGYLFGQYKRLTGEFASGTITGKGLEYGGSLVRTEATGFGTVYFAEHMLNHVGETLTDRVCVVSGSGNVAIHCALKLAEMGAKVVTLSDSTGFIHDPDGLDEKKIEYVSNLKLVRRGKLMEYAKRYSKASYHPGMRPWGVACSAAFPCATQNEINLEEAKTLVGNGCKIVTEGANMPSEEAAMKLFRNKILFGPAKAANAGGVAVSGLEMSQNTMRINWKEDELDSRLKEIMSGIHDQCLIYGETKQGHINYVRGANLAGFMRVGKAMLAHGV